MTAGKLIHFFFLLKKDIMANSQANMQWINLLHKKPNVRDV